MFGDAFNAVGAGVQLLFMHGQNVAIPAGVTEYLLQAIPGLQTATFNDRLTRNATFRNLSIVINSVQPVSGVLTVRLQFQNLDTALFITIPAGAAAGSLWADNAHTVTLQPGGVHIALTNAATAASAVIGAVGVELDF